MNSLERVFTNHLKFLFDIGWGERGGEGCSIFTCFWRYFSPFPIVDQVWLVHEFVASSSSLSPLVAADVLEILSPPKGQDTLLPWGHLGFIPRSSKCSSCSWNSVSGRATSVCLRPANRGNFSFQIYFVKVDICVHFKVFFSKFGFSNVSFENCL